MWNDHKRQSVMPKRGMFSHIGLNTVHLLVLPMVVPPPPMRGAHYRTSAYSEGVEGRGAVCSIGRAGGLPSEKGEKFPF